MNIKIITKEQVQDAVTASQAASNGNSACDGANFVPSTDEVARRAYFNYENEGSKPGHDVQHWLEAETELIDERNKTRVHGFHNRT